MYWTLEARKYLDNPDIRALFPISIKGLIEYLENNLSERYEIPFELLEELRRLDMDNENNENEEYSSIDEMWPGLPRWSDYHHNEDEN